MRAWSIHAACADRCRFAVGALGGRHLGGGPAWAWDGLPGVRMAQAPLLLVINPCEKYVAPKNLEGGLFVVNGVRGCHFSVLVEQPQRAPVSGIPQSTSEWVLFLTASYTVRRRRLSSITRAPCRKVLDDVSPAASSAIGRAARWRGNRLCLFRVMDKRPLPLDKCAGEWPPGAPVRRGSLFLRCRARDRGVPKKMPRLVGVPGRVDGL
jgi:hypothetical protein